LRSGGTRRRLDTPEEQVAQEFGKALFEALLVGDVDAQYRVSLREAKRQNKGLRVKLHVRPPELSALPWEFLYDPERDYLGLSTMTPLVRYLDLTQPVERLTVTPPLRILGMVASPQGLAQLDVKHEKRRVEEAIKRLRADGMVELNWLEGQTWRDLQRAMRRGQWHVFHFIGHGGFDPTTEEGAIALSDEAGRKHLLGARNLARLLDDHFPLRLAFLNSCEGARGNERDAFSSTAAALVRHGVPAVVAMQYEITDTAAVEFSRDFYEAVADGLPVDTAVAEARAALSMESALEWGTPVLYMRSSDGRIFDIQGVSPADSARRYRKSVEASWKDEELAEAEVQRLRERASSLGLSLDISADIEREIMGDTKEEILEPPKPKPPSLPPAPPTRPSWYRWIGRKGLAVMAGTLMLIVLIVGYFIVNYTQEKAAIENLVIGHYEDVEDGTYKQAYSDLGKVEQRRMTGFNGFLDYWTNWCPLAKADPEQPEVGYFLGNRATATVTVHFEHTCGNSPERFNSESKFVWNLSKVEGEWKLYELNTDQTVDTVSSSIPAQAFNGGETFSEFSGEDIGNLKSITASNAVDSAKNGCNETVEYKLANLVDGRGDTTWQVAGTGVGEWIELKYDEPIKVGRVGIIPGYDKTDPCDGTDRFYQMYVVRKARFQFSDGSRIEEDFERKPKMQFVNVPDTETISIRITILDTYPPGEKPGESPYDYTLGKAAISEVKVEGP
jgi:CHAT domain-containing protein